MPQLVATRGARELDFDAEFEGFGVSESESVHSSVESPVVVSSSNASRAQNQAGRPDAAAIDIFEPPRHATNPSVPSLSAGGYPQHRNQGASATAVLAGDGLANNSRAKFGALVLALALVVYITMGGNDPGISEHVTPTSVPDSFGSGRGDFDRGVDKFGDNQLAGGRGSIRPGGAESGSFSPVESPQPHEPNSEGQARSSPPPSSESAPSSERAPSSNQPPANDGKLPSSDPAFLASDITTTTSDGTPSSSQMAPEAERVPETSDPTPSESTTSVLSNSAPGAASTARTGHASPSADSVMSGSSSGSVPDSDQSPSVVSASTAGGDVQLTNDKKKSGPPDSIPPETSTTSASSELVTASSATDSSHTLQGVTSSAGAALEHSSSASDGKLKSEPPANSSNVTVARAPAAPSPAPELTDAATSAVVSTTELVSEAGSGSARRGETYAGGTATNDVAGSSGNQNSAMGSSEPENEIAPNGDAPKISEKVIDEADLAPATSAALPTPMAVQPERRGSTKDAGTQFKKQDVTPDDEPAEAAARIPQIDKQDLTPNADAPKISEKIIDEADLPLATSTPMAVQPESTGSVKDAGLQADKQGVTSDNGPDEALAPIMRDGKRDLTPDSRPDEAPALSIPADKQDLTSDARPSSV